MTYKPHKAYYAFMAFNELRKLGQAVKATTDGTKGLSVCAAKKGNAAAIFCANDTDQPMPISCKLDGYSVVSVRYTDGEKTDAVVSANDIPADAALPPRSLRFTVPSGARHSMPPMWSTPQTTTSSQLPCRPQLSLLSQI